MCDLICLTIITLLSINQAQQCLKSPPAVTHTPTDPNDIKWKELSPGQYYTSLEFTATTFHKSSTMPTTWTTRVYNNSLPGITLRMVRSNQYFINFTNKLGPEAATNPTTMNIIKDLNTTNLHLHGVHVSGEGYSDNIFKVIAPNENYLYHYYLPCDHAGGTFWYHAHHHTSTSVQVGGGAAGALIIEDSPKQESLPIWYTNMTELIVVIQSFDLGYIHSLGTIEPDLLFKFAWNGPLEFYLLNGLYQPTICLQNNEWRKLRIVYVDPIADFDLFIVNEAGEDTDCEIKLLAKDGILLNNVPRTVKSMYFTPSSRADIAIWCPTATATNASYRLSPDRQTIIGYIQVNDHDAVGEINADILTTFAPNRPSYIENLLNYTGPVNKFSINMTDTQVNDLEFNSTSFYQTVYESGSINEWSLQHSTLQHPTHSHLFHFQIKSFEEPYGPYNWTQVGDWIDTMQTVGVVRFKANRWGGHVVLHCHILAHEDHGSMMIGYVTGGCNWNLTNMHDTNGNVIYPLCQTSCAPPWNESSSVL